MENAVLLEKLTVAAISRSLLAFAVGFSLFAGAGCGSASKRTGGETPSAKSESSGASGAAGTRQCGEFCERLDRCLGSEFGDKLKAQLCELARCESGCRPRIRSSAGYEGAYQFARKTWRSVCGPIFARRNLPHCRGEDARNDLCCAAICTAEMVDRGGIKHWPTCGN